MVLFRRGKKRTALPDKYQDVIFGIGKKDEKVKLSWVGKILKFVGWYLIKKKFSK